MPTSPPPPQLEAIANGIEIGHGDALRLLTGLASESVAAVVTDPPYSSGGSQRDSARPPHVKYVSSDAKTVLPDFAGDSRDQRSHTRWSALWLSECLRAARPGAIACVFTDWRQLPTTTDALQMGGWVWQGVFVWAKNAGRPRRGGFRNQAEFVVWGSKGPMRRDGDAIYLPGVVTTGLVKGPRKLHMTEKPLELMETLVQVAPPGDVVLDPFMGSGSTGAACLRTGRRFVGMEISDVYFDVAARRLRDSLEDYAAA